MKKLTDTEIEHRKPVWIALSDLFLDTDVTLSYEYIARVCAESRYSSNELRDILKHEVAPVVCFNLMSVAGEWVGFDEQWLVTRIRKKINRRSGIFATLLKPFKFGLFGFDTYLDEHWREIGLRIEELRN